MIGGTYGKILHVDLTQRTSWEEEPPDEVYRLLVGGRALVAYLLLRDMPPRTDALAPDNLLIFAPGILQGTNLPGAGRHGVGAKSPLTGALASSEAGGWWGHEFKRSGFDALVLHGRASEPLYVWIHDGEVELRPAGHLWGQDTAATEKIIRQELGDEAIRVAQIGPAGERLVRYAAIMHDVNRAAGRNGLGAVMGSKNLKAVAVRGSMWPTVVERKRVSQVAKWLGANYRTLTAWATEGIGRGTQDSIMNWGALGGLPTKNFSLPMFENRHLLSGERNYEMFLKSRDTCQSCPIRCKQVFEHDDPDPRRRLDPVYGGPEYEAMGAFGSTCLVEDNLAVAKANELANAYGLDTISTGASIGFVMEAFERGLLNANDTGGIEFRWGDGDVLLQAIELIAHRQGFGDVMAEGVARMAARLGPEAETFNITVKGQELPMHEPRLKHALGVGYAVAPVGADHMMNVHDTSYANPGEALKRVNAAMPKPVGPMSPFRLDEDKMQVFYREVAWRHFEDCAICCHFYPYHYEHLAQALSGVTGVEYSIADILAVGERAQTLARLFNYGEGLTVADDRLPRRVMKAFESGPLAGIEITEEAFNWAKRRFYELMAWDAETGAPTTTSLQRLQLDSLPGLQLTMTD